MKIGETVSTGSESSISAKEATEVQNTLESNDNTSRRLSHVFGHVYGEKAKTETKEKSPQPKPQLSEP